MLTSVVTVGVAAYAGIVVLAFLGQHRMLFMATKDIYRTPAENGWTFDEVKLDVDGGQTHAWYVHADENPKGTVLFSHGNAGNIADRLESIGIFRRMGYDVLAYDYGGYGKSSGRPREKRCYEDVRAMWRYLTDERGIAADRIVLFGRSLGAGVTAQLATEVDAAAVVIESTFTSVPDRAQEIYRFLPAKLFVTIKFDNASKIPRVRSPLLVIHSRDDTIIPFHHGEKLFELAPEPKTFFELTGDHNEGFWMSGDTYTNALEKFLDPLMIGAARE